ncbi:MAG TPA: hypothetical protein VMW27_06695 [Thermoanaerobaculia bacterium]|nr:hypothetical protein [Thermoanaerobaculia bacterium]
MNNGKELHFEGSPLHDPIFWTLLRSEPTRTLDVLQRHFGSKPAVTPEMERLCWELLIEHCEAGDLARTLLQRLRPGGGGRLLEVEDGDRDLLYRHFEKIALERLACLGLSDEELRRIRGDALLLAETALAGQGDGAAAAAFCALVHDERLSGGEDGPELAALREGLLRCLHK